MADIDIRILQLLNVKAVNRIDENAIEITLPKPIPQRTEASGVKTNTEITVSARPESKYKNAKTVRYRRNTLQEEFDGYPEITPTASRPLWKNILYSEMMTLVSNLVSMFCIDPSDVDMSSFGDLFPADSRGRRYLDLKQVINNKVTVILHPTQDNYYYNGPVTLVFKVIDKSYSYLD